MAPGFAAMLVVNNNEFGIRDPEPPAAAAARPR